MHSGQKHLFPFASSKNSKYTWSHLLILHFVQKHLLIHSSFRFESPRRQQLFEIFHDMLVLTNSILFYVTTIISYWCNFTRVDATVPKRA